MYPRRMLPVILALALIGPQALPADWYVATAAGNGNDAHVGTLAAPFATLKKALGVVQPGDTVYIRGGTYDLAGTNLTLGNLGTTTEHITIANYPGEAPVFANGAGHVFTVSGQYLDLKGIEIRDAGQSGIHVSTGKHIQILGCVVRAAREAGIWIGNTGSLTDAVDVLVQGCEIVNCSAAKGSSGNLQTFGATNVRLIGNTVHQNWGEGIILLLCDHGVATGNTLWDNKRVDLYIDNATNSLVDSNLIYNTGDPAFMNGTSRPTSIRLANEAGYPFQNFTAGITITNNLAIGGDANISWNQPSTNPGPRACLIANNVFVAATFCNAFVLASSGASGNVVENNIFYQNGGTNSIIAASGYTYRNNCWFGTGGGAGNGAGANDRNADPKFAGTAGSFTPASYKLQAGSPCIDAGSTVSAVPADFFGTARPQGAASDIGIHESAAPRLTPSSIGPASLPGGTAGAVYSATAFSASGTPPITWSLSAGTLPPGLSFSSTGVLSGTPAAPGTASFTVRAMNASGAATKAYSVAIAASPTLVDRTDEIGGIITARGDNAVNGEGKAQAFDNNVSTKWLDTVGSSWIQYRFAGDAAYVITTYTIASANDHPERDPAQWTLSGSNDGVSYATLDQRTGQTFANRYQTNTYSVANATAYKMYRFALTAGSGAMIQLAEIGLLGASTSQVVASAPVVATAAATATRTVTGTRATLDVLGGPPAEEPAFMYTWSVTEAPSGGGASFTPNGTNAAKTTAVTFTRAGSYALQVAVTGADGASTISGPVVIDVAAVLSGIAVSGPATISTGSVATFTATAYDQFSQALSQQPDFTWTASGGTVSADGTYTAGPAAGRYGLTAAAGDHSDSAALTVVAAPNAGTATPQTATQPQSGHACGGGSGFAALVTLLLGLLSMRRWTRARCPTRAPPQR